MGLAFELEPRNTESWIYHIRTHTEIQQGPRVRF